MATYHTSRDPSDRSSASTSGTGQPRIACEACSTAKTGCDKAEPSCTRCKEKGIHCKTRFARRGGKPQAKPQAKQGGITTSISQPSAGLEDSHPAEARQNGLSASPVPMMTPSLSLSSSANGPHTRPSLADDVRFSVEYGIVSDPNNLVTGESISSATGPPEGLILAPSTGVSNQQYHSDFVWGGEFLTEDSESGLDAVTVFSSADQDDTSQASSHLDTAVAGTLQETAATFPSPNDNDTPITWNSLDSATLSASDTASGRPYPIMQSMIGQFDNGGANVMHDGAASMVSGVTLSEIAPEVPNMSNTPMLMSTYLPHNDMPNHTNGHTSQPGMGGWSQSPELPSLPVPQGELVPRQLGGPQQQQIPQELGNREIWLESFWPRNCQLRVVPGPFSAATEISKVIDYLHHLGCAVDVVCRDSGSNGKGALPSTSSVSIYR